MATEELVPELIDSSDERYRISEELHVPILESSIREIGQLTPVLLARADGGRYRIVAGFRRMHSLAAMSGRTVLARVVPDHMRPLELMHMALWDNLSHRKLSPLETARLVTALRDSCCVPEQELMDKWLPLTGLPGHPMVLRTYLSFNRLEPGIRELLRMERITLHSAERIAAMDAPDQERVAWLLEAVRLSSSLQRKILDLLDDVAGREGSTIAEVLRRPAILDIAADGCLSPFQKGERVYQSLYRWRNPRLVRAQTSFLAEKERLRLPGSVKISPEPNFETNRVRFEFEVTSAGELRDIAAKLVQAGTNPAIDKLFDVV